MSTEANLPDLIITISHHKVRLDLLGDPAAAREAWSSSFSIDHLFLGQSISESIDQALLINPALLDYFPCVEIVVLDIPNIRIPKVYHQSGKTMEIASRYLRLRAGDSFNTDITSGDLVLCYTLPTFALQVLREYYSTITCSHFSTLLWNYLSSQPQANSRRLYFSIVEDNLTIMGVDNNHLFFLKNFRIRHQDDAVYFSMACSSMLKVNEHYILHIEGQSPMYHIHESKGFSIDRTLYLPSMASLMAQYKPCGS